MDFDERYQLYMSIWHNENFRDTVLFREYAPCLDAETKQIIAQVQTEIRNR